MISTRSAATTPFDGVPYACPSGMGRTLRIRVSFEPTRLSAQWLQGAFEVVVPITRRHPSRDEVATATSDILEPTTGRGSAKEGS